VAGATTLAGRLVAAHGEPLALTDAALRFVFPRPEALAQADLTRIGLPRARARAISQLAAAVADGTIGFDAPGDPESLLARLRALPGIGEWTAQVVAMRALREPDAFPAGDLGLRRALARNGRPASEQALLRAAEAWRPWRAYAAMLLWSTPRSARGSARSRRSA
jgi:AraC family transcriptional regulator of adaptative response / DNA-3-methyladenine glycosylase II